MKLKDPLSVYPAPSAAPKLHFVMVLAENKQFPKI